MSPVTTGAPVKLLLVVARIFDGNGIRIPSGKPEVTGLRGQIADEYRLQ